MKTCRAAKYWQLKKRENQVVKNSIDSLYVIDMCRNRFGRPPSLISSEIFQAKWLINKKLIGDISHMDFFKLISRSILIVNKCILLNCLVKISRGYDQLYMYYNAIGVFYVLFYIMLFVSRLSFVFLSRHVLFGSCYEYDVIFVFFSS